MTLLSAVFSGFFLIRIIKGPWMRHSHYLGLAMIGSILAMLALAFLSPGLQDDFIAGNLGAFAIAFAAIWAFDHIVGMILP